VFLLFLLVAAIIGLAFRLWWTRPENKNLIIVTLDTVRADFIGAYGYPELCTPNMDSFAKRALVFERAYATAPRTSPSHASIFTSQHPSKHGVIFNGEDLPKVVSKKSVMLAEHLKARGFATGAVVSAPPVGTRYGFDRGFDDFVGIATEYIKDETGWLHPILDSGGDGRAVTDWAVRWMARHAYDRFFLWAHYYEAHLPYHCAPEVYRALGIKDVNVTDEMAKEMDRSELLQQYRAEVYELDRYIGELLRALDDLGLVDKTVVALVADHGEYLQEHGQIGHQLLYDKVLHVPMMVFAPKQVSPARRSGVVSTVDLAPTLLEILGAAPLPTAQGRSLMDEKPNQESVPVFAEWRFHEPFMGQADPKPTDMLYSVQLGDDKYVYDALFPESSELYDLRLDPAEANDIFKSRHEKKQPLITRMNAHLQSDIDIPPGTIDTIKLDDHTIEMLKRLGYMR
jgi:arylsulfatase A-like enzyme